MHFPAGALASSRTAMSFTIRGWAVVSGKMLIRHPKLTKQIYRLVVGKDEALDMSDLTKALEQK